MTALVVQLRPRDEAAFPPPRRTDHSLICSAISARAVEAWNDSNKPAWLRQALRIKT